MENINSYLLILTGLIAFFAAIVLYLKFNYQKFTNCSLSPIDVVRPFNIDYLNNNVQDVQSEDTRYRYGYLPPVNPFVNNTTRETNILSSPDLSLCCDQGNLLEYSGGMSQMLTIPLQYNDPYNEPLRSTDILVTDYNRIKYGWRK